MAGDPFDSANSDTYPDPNAPSRSAFDSPDFWRNLEAFGANTLVAANARTPQGFLQYGAGIAGPVGAGVLGAMEASRQNAALGSQIGLRGAQTQNLNAELAQKRIQTQMQLGNYNFTAPFYGTPKLDQNGNPIPGTAGPGFFGSQGGSQNGQPGAGQQSQPQQQAQSSGQDITPSGDLPSRVSALEGGPGTGVNSKGYLGEYQFGTAALTDAGIYKPAPGEDPTKNTWQGTINIAPWAPMTSQQFTANPQAQKIAFETTGKRNLGIAQQQGLTNYIGQTVGGVPITADSLIGMMHFGGVAGTAAFLRSGGQDNPSDGHMTLAEYGRSIAGISTKMNQQAQYQQSGQGGAQQPNGAPISQEDAYMLAKNALSGQLTNPTPQQAQAAGAVLSRIPIPGAQQLSKQLLAYGYAGAQAASVAQAQLPYKSMEMRPGGMGFDPRFGWVRNPQVIETQDAQGAQHPMFAAPPMPGTPGGIGAGGGMAPITAPGGIAGGGSGPSGEVTTKLGPYAEGQQKARGEITAGDIEHDRKDIDESLAASVGNQQAAQQQLLQLRDLADKADTGAFGEFRAGMKNYFQTFAPKWAANMANIDAVPAQEFMKVTLMNAGNNERETLGSRGGFYAMQMFTKANPSIELQPQANREMANALLISHQRGIDYAQGATDWYHANHDVFQSGAGPYQPVSKYDQQFMTRYKPELYYSAIQAINGKPFSEWANGLSAQQGRIVAGIVKRADSNALIDVQGHRVPVSSLDNVASPSDMAPSVSPQAPSQRPGGY